jgi:hypothetical protein
MKIRDQPPWASPTGVVHPEKPPSREQALCLDSPAAHHIRPSVGTPPRVHSRPGPRTDPSVAWSHPDDLVPPSWFLTTSAACSARRFRVCCNPNRPWGSPRFSRTSSLLPAPRLPATRPPLDEFPSLTAVPHHCGLMPSCRYRPPLTTPEGAAARLPRRSAGEPCENLQRAEGQELRSKNTHSRW